jgi:hypothetical protein
VLNLVQPHSARRRPWRFRRQARLDESGWQGTRTRQHADLIGQADEDGKASALVPLSRDALSDCAIV